MTKLDWTKAKTYREYEIKYDDGTEMKNGRIIRHRVRDSLEARARFVEDKWLKRLKKQPGKQKI